MRTISRMHSFFWLVVLGALFFSLSSTVLYAMDEFGDIAFPHGGAKLSQKAKADLERVASWLKNNPDARIQIQGFADKRGRREDNMAMGERRAGTVKTYLIGLGIAAERMDTVSFGEEHPIDPGNTDAALAKNRRCHLVALSK
jgi:peptidoglycan-associated lipoprotein